MDYRTSLDAITRQIDGIERLLPRALRCLANIYHLLQIPSVHDAEVGPEVPIPELK